MLPLRGGGHSAAARWIQSQADFFKAPTTICSSFSLLTPYRQLSRILRFWRVICLSQSFRLTSAGVIPQMLQRPSAPYEAVGLPAVGQCSATVPSGSRLSVLCRSRGATKPAAPPKRAANPVLTMREPWARALLLVADKPYAALRIISDHPRAPRVRSKGQAGSERPCARSSEGRRSARCADHRPGRAASAPRRRPVGSGER
jgi:hypothetical protein